MTGVKVEAPPQSPNGTTPQPTTQQDGSKLITVPAYPPYIPPPHLPRPPFVDVDGIANFRDIGGYPCSPYGQPNTHMVRRGLVYRCALPNLVTPKGMTTTTETLGITAVYDLRSTPEINRANAAAPNPHVNTLTTIRRFTPVYAEQDYGPDALARKLKWYSSPNNNPDFVDPSTVSSPKAQSLPSYSLGFVNAYRDISLHGISAYRTIFTHILQSPPSPLVFHCTAGKDRTGVLAALILRLCGVSDDTICWEYALTEPGLGQWRDVFMGRMSSSVSGTFATSTPSSTTTPAPSSPTTTSTSNGEKASTAVSTHPSSKITLEEAARICGARSPNMRAYLTLILDGEFGGVTRYMTEKLGFSLDEVNTIRANLLAPVPDDGSLTELSEIPGWTPEGGVVEEFERLPRATAKTAIAGGGEGSEITYGQGKVGPDSVLGIDEDGGREKERHVMVS